METDVKSVSKKEKWAERMPLLASFLLPLLIIFILCIERGIFPFGERSMLRMDMWHQYCPFYTELLNKLQSGESLMYSFHVGMGSDFISLIAYYLASPVNVLLLIWPKGYIIEFMSITIALRIAFCGFTFAYYLKRHFAVNHFIISFFGLAYAFCGFIAAYSYNIMWLDCVMLAPLIVLGLEQLVKEKKGGLYYGTLAFSIFSNYYISIIICIFLLLYFLILWVEQKGDRIKTALRFAWYSLLAGGTAAVLLIPEIHILGISASQKNPFPEKIEWYFNVMAGLSRHCALTESYTDRDHLPNIYSGVFILLFLVLYLLNKEIAWKKKLSRMLLVALFAVGFANNILDFFWHGMHFPNSLPGRQTFLYTFLLLAFSYEALHFRDGIRVWHVAAALLLDAAFLAGAYLFREEAKIGVTELSVTAGLLLGYGVITIVWLLLKHAWKGGILFVMSCLMLSELAVNFHMTGLHTSSRVQFLENREDYDTVLSAAEQREKERSRTGAYFYRTEEMERMTKNDGALYGYSSVSQFSSLMNKGVSKFLQKLGLEVGGNNHAYNGTTPLISALLSVKYVLSDSPLWEDSSRTLVESSGNTYLYENKYTLPLGFMISEEAVSAWDYKEGNAFERQNQLAWLLGADEPLFTEVESWCKPGASLVLAVEDGYYYAIYDKIESAKLKVEISDGREREYEKASYGYILDFGYCKERDSIEVTNTEEETVQTHAYKMNERALEAAFYNLNSQTMELSEFSASKIAGTIAVRRSGRFVLSIPNEDGWTLYVDGKEAEKESFGEAFISTHLDRGVHTIELRYETPGLKTGLVISLGSIFLFAATIIRKNHLHPVLFLKRKFKSGKIK